MDDFGKLWFEMGVRDKVTEHITQIMQDAAAVHKEMDAITASERAVYENASKLEQVYDKIAIAMQRIGDARSMTNDSNKLRKLNEMEEVLNKMKAAFKEIEENETKMGLKGTVALEQLKQGFQLMTTQVSRYANEIENTSKKESKAHDDEIRRQDKLKSKLYELQNLRKKISDAILEAPADYDTSAASHVAGQLWSKEMQIRRYMNNGREVPLDFFGADYAELKRQVDEYSRAATKAHRDAASAVQQNARANQQLVSTYDQVIEKSKGTNTVLRQMEIQLASTFSLYSAEHLLKSVIQVGGEFEQQHIALQNILGDVEEANTLFNQIQTLAVVSPFNFRQLTSYTKQTAAYGIPYEELYDTTKRLADLSAGLGVDMGRLILAYGQVRSASVLRGQELRQFTEAGIPLVQKLADKFTELNGRVVTTGEVFDFISKRKVPFEMVKEILWDMTDAGGSFYQMQFKLSDTLLGKWSNLQDAWEIMLSKFAEGGSTGGDALKWLVQEATDLIESLDRLSPVITGVVGGLGFMKISKFATGDIFNTEKAILDAKKLEAARLRRDSLTRTLSEREKEILQTSNKITINDIKALSQAGRLNTLKLQQLYVNKQLTQQDVARLVNEKAITVEQGAQIANATRLKVVLGSLKETATRIGSGIWSTVTNPAFLMTAALSAALSVYASWKEAENERLEIAESVGKSIVDQYNQILKVQKDIEKSSPTTDGDYLKGINEMTETLKNIGAYSGDIESQARFIENLADKYSFLKKKLDEAAVAYENLSRHAKTSTEYAISKTDGWFDESIVTNMKDLTDTLDEYDKAAIGIQRFGAIIQNQVEKLSNYFGNESLRKQIDGKSIEEQLKIIAESGQWQTIENMVTQTSADAGAALKDFNEAYFEVLSDWNTVTGEDLPEFIQGIEDAFKREHPDIDLSNLDDEMKLELKRFVHQALTEVDGVRQDIKDRLEQDIDAHFKINVDFELSISTPPDYWRVQYPILNQLYGKLSDSGINMGNDFYNNIGEGGGATSSDKLWKYMDSQVDELQKKWQAEEKLYGAASEQATKAKTAYDNMKKARDTAFGGSVKDLKKSGGSQKDTILEGWKEELKEIKAFWSEYEKYLKYMTSSQAVDEIQKKGLFPTLFDDKGRLIMDVREGLGGALNDLLAKTNGETTQRRALQLDIKKAKADVELKDVEETAKSIIDQINKELSEQGKNWDLYRKIFEATGNATQASNIAFANGNAFSSFAKQLRSQIGSALESLPDAKALGIDKLLGMDKESLHKLGIFENATNGIYQMLEKLREAESKTKEEEVGIFIEALKNAKSLDTELEAITRKYDKTREAIRKNGGGDNLIENANTEEQREKANKQWEWFKKNTEGWGEIFGNLDYVTSSAIDNMIQNLENQIPKIQDSEEAMKALYEALDKLRQEKISRSPFTTLFESLQRRSRLQDLYKGLPNGSSFTATKEQAKYYGLTTGRTYSKEDIKKLRKGEEANFNESLKGIKASFNALQDVMDPVISLFETLGETGISDILNIGNGMFDNAIGISDGLQSLGGLFGEDSAIGKALGNAGPWGAAAGAALGLVEGIFALHDKALQREIEASQARQKEMENLTENLQTVLERTLGGIYGVTTGKDILSSLENEIRNPYQGWSDWKADMFDVDNTSEYRSYFKQETIDAVKNAEKTKKYYDATYASLLAQRDELVHQMESESDKKNSDADKLADYRQQIVEMEDQIKYFAQDMAKSLWDIDVKSWAKTLTETIVDTWKKGGNAVDAYKNKVREMMLDLTTNILSQRVMEKMLEEVGLDDLIADLMKSTKGELDVNAIAEIADSLYMASEESTETILSILDMMEQRGYISKGDEESATSTNGIGKAITEQDTSLWSSYLNSIRADVSMNRVTLAQILSVVQGTSEMPAIARSQLEQLKQIAANTNRNANAAELIYEILHRVSPDGTYIKIK